MIFLEYLHFFLWTFFKEKLRKRTEEPDRDDRLKKEKLEREEREKEREREREERERKRRREEEEKEKERARDRERRKRSRSRSRHSSRTSDRRCSRSRDHKRSRSRERRRSRSVCVEVFSCNFPKCKNLVVSLGHIPHLLGPLFLSLQWKHTLLVPRMSKFSVHILHCLLSSFGRGWHHCGVSLIWSLNYSSRYF